MGCVVCLSEDGHEVRSFGGGRRFACVGCGGYFQVSSTLDALMGNKVFHVDETRRVLEQRRATLARQPLDPNNPQGREPILNSDDRDLLVNP